MADLIRDYFERDLDDLEFARLEKMVEENQAEALRLLGLAEEAYQAGGLPEPRSGVEGRRWVKPMALAAGLAGLALLAVVWMKMGAPGHAPERLAALPATPVPAQGPALASAVKPGQAPVVGPVEASQKAALASLSQAVPAHGNTAFSVHFTTQNLCGVTVRVFDAKNRLVKSIFSGLSQAGSYTYTWDRRLQDGRPAPAGDYWIQVETTFPQRTTRKAVTIR